MKELIFSNDSYRMNWFREDAEYAKVNCPEELSYTVKHEKNGDVITTTLTIINNGNKPYFTKLDDIGIYFPFQDRYESSAVCMTQRCHTHIFCGGDVAWIMALRMGGAAPHLGIYFTKGSIAHYSVERDVSSMSNDRGIFILHPSPMMLDAGERAVISWDLFPHEGKEDFQNKLRQYNGYIEVSAEQYVLFESERTAVTIKPYFAVDHILADGKAYPVENGCATVQFTPEGIGEHSLKIKAGDKQTQLRLLVMPQPEKLAGKRCRFIADKQQYFGKCGHLNGAYLIYDNEEQRMYYTPENDFNGGRERVGMALLMVRYLRKHTDDRLTDSLKKYVDFVLRELVDAPTGEVYNDVGRDNSFVRLYNDPWFAELFVELYGLWKNKEYLTIAVNIMRRNYAAGGAAHYSTEIPILLLTNALKDAQMSEEYEEMKALFVSHADQILKIGTSYPAHEVNYEQSIVAPAAEILFQVYLLTKDKKYFDGGCEQMNVLELFNGIQPDCYLYEAAIRHWDGYWFGKRRMYGDTFPHYWSALTANVYLLYAICTQSEQYWKKAQAGYRNVLRVFRADGSASCAYVFPYSINGIRADYEDEFANDQDWGLYFMLRLTEVEDWKQQIKMNPVTCG